MNPVSPDIMLGVMEVWQLFLSWVKKLFRVTPASKPLLKYEVDYQFTEIMLDEWVNAVKLLDGPYKNVVYYYGHVKIIPQEDGSHRLAFQYTIWDSAGFDKATLTANPQFIERIGDVLVSIITDENRQGEYATPREHDSEESDL